MNKLLAIAIGALLSCVPFPSFSQDVFDGGRQSIRSKGHQKAKGLDLQIDFPKTWLAEEGKRPNVVVKVTSQGGRGLETCNLIVRDMEMDSGKLGYRPTPKELAYLTSPAGLKEEAEASGMHFLKGASTTVEGSPAGWFIAKQPQGRAGLDVYLYFFVLEAFFDKWRVFLTCGAGGSSDAVAQSAYQSNDMRFRLIANSMVFFNKYK